MSKGLLAILATSLCIGCYSQSSYRWAPPILSVDSTLFHDSARVQVHFGDPSAEIIVSINGGIREKYEGPLYVSQTSVIEAYAKGGGLKESAHSFEQALKLGDTRITWISKTIPSSKYPEDRDELRNQKPASGDFKHPEWVGYSKDSVVYEFSTKNAINGVAIAFLHNPNAWIMAPVLSVLTAHESGQLVYIDTQRTAITPQQTKTFHLWRGFSEPTKVRGYINWTLTIYAEVLPPDHAGAGKRAWLFTDELIVY